MEANHIFLSLYSKQQHLIKGDRGGGGSAKEEAQQ